MCFDNIYTYNKPRKINNSWSVLDKSTPPPHQNIIPKQSFSKSATFEYHLCCQLLVILDIGRFEDFHARIIWMMRNPRHHCPKMQKFIAKRNSEYHLPAQLVRTVMQSRFENHQKSAQNLTKSSGFGC